jgi:hypothetical protein
VGDDRVVLTDLERQALAGLAEQVGDPWLARQLVGQDAPAPNQEPSLGGSILQRVTSSSTSGWVGLLLVLAGAALVTTAFAHSIVLGSFGLLLMGVGLWRLVVDQGDIILGRWAEKRRAPVPVPPPPRTPPAAL